MDPSSLAQHTCVAFRSEIQSLSHATKQAAHRLPHISSMLWTIGGHISSPIGRPIAAASKLLPSSARGRLPTPRPTPAHSWHFVILLTHALPCSRPSSVQRAAETYVHCPHDSMRFLHVGFAQGGPRAI